MLIPTTTFAEDRPWFKVKPVSIVGAFGLNVGRLARNQAYVFLNAPAFDVAISGCMCVWISYADDDDDDVRTVWVVVVRGTFVSKFAYVVVDREASKQVNA